MIARVLIIAGSDSGGGAGIQADIKTVTVLGGYAMTAVTALTAQNTLGVSGVHEVPEDFIRAQMDSCLADIGADAIKTGMLARSGAIETVTDVIARRAGGVPLIVDPVMVAKGGARLLDPAANSALKTYLIPHAALLTPNIPEAEELTGRVIASVDEMRRAAEMLLSLGPAAVLLKGGHLDLPRIFNVLATNTGLEVFETERLKSRSTHGTGCTLASAIATFLARGEPLGEAVARAQDYVLAAIQDAPGLGKGHGPLAHLNHAVAIQEKRTRII